MDINSKRFEVIPSVLTFVRVNTIFSILAVLYSYYIESKFSNSLSIFVAFNIFSLIVAEQMSDAIGNIKLYNILSPLNYIASIIAVIYWCFFSKDYFLFSAVLFIINVINLCIALSIKVFRMVNSSELYEFTKLFNKKPKNLDIYYKFNNFSFIGAFGEISTKYGDLIINGKEYSYVQVEKYFENNPTDFNEFKRDDITLMDMTIY